MVRWSYFWVGKTIECSPSELLHRSPSEALAVRSAGVDLGFFDVDPAEDGHELVRRRTVVSGTSRGGLAEPVSRLVHDAGGDTGVLERVAQRLLDVWHAVFLANE